MKTLFSLMLALLTTASLEAQDIVVRAFNDSIAPTINALRSVNEHAFYIVETQFGADSAVLYRATPEVDMLTKVRMLDPITPVRSRLYSADGEWCLSFAHAAGSTSATALDICNVAWNTHRQLSFAKSGSQLSFDAAHPQDVYQYSSDGTCALIRLIETSNGVQQHALAVVSLTQARVVAIVTDRSTTPIASLELMDVSIDIAAAQAFFSYRTTGKAPARCIVHVVNMETSSTKELSFSILSATVMMRTTVVPGTDRANTVVIGTRAVQRFTLDARAMSVVDSTSFSLDSLCPSPKGRRLLLSESQHRLLISDSVSTSGGDPKNLMIVDLLSRTVLMKQQCDVVPTALCFNDDETEAVFCYEMDILRYSHHVRESFYARLPYIWQSNEHKNLNVSIAFRPTSNAHQLYISNAFGAVTRLNLDAPDQPSRELIRKADASSTGAQMSFSASGDFLCVNSAAICLTRKMAEQPAGLICRFYGDGVHYTTMSPGRINYCVLPFNTTAFACNDFDVVAMDLSRSTDSIAVAQKGGYICFSSHKNLKVRVPFARISAEVRALHISPDGSVLVAISADNQAFVYDVLERALLGQLNLAPNTSTCFSVDSRAVYYIDTDTSIALWSIAHRRHSSRLVVPHGHLNNLCFSSDAKMLACATRDGFILVWRLDSLFNSKQLVVPVKDDLDVGTIPSYGNTIRITSPMVYSATTLSIYNEQGVEVHHESLTPESQSINVNLESLYSGFYVLVLRGSDFMQSQRVVVVH